MHVCLTVHLPHDSAPERYSRRSKAPAVPRFSSRPSADHLAFFFLFVLLLSRSGGSRTQRNGCEIRRGKLLGSSCLPSAPHAEVSKRLIFCSAATDSGTRIQDPGEVRKLLNAAARDCVPEDRNSIVAFEARTGVEVCTFHLILKNASPFLDNDDPTNVEADNDDPTNLEAEAKLGELIRQKVKDGLNGTVFALGKFEESMKHCLGV